MTITGLLGLVFPAGLANGLALAIELDGPAGSDRQLLEIGLSIEVLLASEVQTDLTVSA